MRFFRAIATSILTLGLLICVSPTLAKVPVMVMTDFGEDPDDEQSMVRFLMFSNDMDVKGLLVTADPSDGTNTVQSGELRSMIDSYGNDLNNLRKLDSDYPSASYLKSVVKDDMFLSSPFGATNVGSDSKFQTPAVNHIISEVDKSSEPIWFIAWGGARPISQAIYTVKNSRSSSEFNEFLSKVRVYAIYRQDNSYDWVYQNARDTFWIYNGTTSDQAKQTFRGMYQTGNTSLVNSTWINTYINNHGSLSGRYPRTAAGVNGIKEGDTPSFLHLLNPTLNDPDQPTQGGWGGRFQKKSDRPQFFVDLSSGPRETVSQWREAFQNAFAARLDWAKSGSGNRAPNIQVSGATTISVAKGSTVTLDVSNTNDPDGNSLSFEWKHDNNADSYSGSVSINTSNNRKPVVSIPSDAGGKNIHIILSVKDNGSPNLWSYQRFVINVTNEAPQPVKIMPLGNSITQSNSSHNSYRRPLWKKLESNGFTVDFVGSLNTNHNGGPPNTDFDRDHEGHWGWEINEVLQYIDNWASSNTPDIVLIHLGTNDAFAGQSTSSSINELSQLIDKLRSHNSSVKILLAQPINHSRSDLPSIKPLVDAIPQLASKSTAQSPVYIVDMYTGFNASSMTFDAVHPNEAGEQFMADKWYDVLSQVLQGGTTPTPTPTPTAPPTPIAGLEEYLTDFSVDSSRTYRWQSLSSNTNLYTDRSYSFSNIPNQYQDLFYLQTANDDKGSSANTDLISFKAVKDLIVYVAYTDVNTQIGNWLSSWNTDNPSINSNLDGNEATRLVASKTFSAGSTVTLKGNGGTSGQTSMYNVLIAENNTGSCQLAGDVNEDGIVNLTDFSLLSNDFFKTNPTNAGSDINDDGIVNLADFSILSGNFFAVCE